VLVLTTQLVVLFGVGIGFVGLNVRGSWLALALVVMAFEVCLVCIGVALLAVCTTVMQLTAISNLSAIVLGALGGALVPVATLPGWAQAIAPVTPTYWAMRGLRTTTLEAAGVGDVAAPVLVLFGFALFFACVAAVRLSTGSPKVAWA